MVVPGDTTGTWEKTNSGGLNIAWSLGSATSISANAWQTTASNATTSQTQWISTASATFFLTGVQLELGTIATPFERRSFGQELLLCQRYFQTFPASTIYAANSYPNVSLSSGTQVPTFLFPVEMRATPSPSPPPQAAS